MDGQYPADLNQKPETPEQQQAPAPGFAPVRPPEDEDLYLPPSQRQKPKWRRILTKCLKIFALILLVVALAGGAYWQFFRDKKPPATTVDQKPKQTQVINAYTGKTKEINSTNVGLTLTYPETWGTTDATEELTITSPVTSLTDAAGQQFSGKIVLSIQPKGTMPKAFDASGVIAAADSQKIAYVKPTPVQRSQTYVSFVQYTESFAKDQLDALFTTGDFGYQTNQFVPKTDIAKLDPLISVTFLKCDTDQCANPAPSSLQTAMWTNDANFQKAILDMLKSIKVNS